MKQWIINRYLIIRYLNDYIKTFMGCYPIANWMRKSIKTRGMSGFRYYLANERNKK